MLDTVGGGGVSLYYACGIISRVPWGYLAPWRDVMINVGDNLSTVGVFSTMGDIMSTMGDILNTVGVILSTLGDTQYRGGYHDARGGIS